MSGFLSSGIVNADTIPDSAILNAKGTDYDGSKWVSNIGGDIPDAGGSPTQDTVTANNETYDVVSYDGDDYSQNSNLSTSSTKHAIIYTVSADTVDTGDNEYWIDGGNNNEFAVLMDNTSTQPYLIGMSSSFTTGPDDETTDWFTYCLEREGDTQRLLRNGTNIVNHSPGGVTLSGLTLMARFDGTNPHKADWAEVTVLEGQTQQERDSEIARQRSIYGN